MSKKRKIKQYEEISYEVFNDTKEQSRNKFLRKKRNNKFKKFSKQELW
jgi:hypothetical protein